TNDSEARIDAGALINQNPAYQQATQTVSVDGETTFDAINFVGNVYIDLSPDNIKKAYLKEYAKNGFGGVAAAVLPGTQATLLGVGASVELVLLNDTTMASVGYIHTFDPTNAVNSTAKTIDLGFNHN